MKVVFQNFTSHEAPGTVIRVFGYDAIVQPDKTIVCDMNIDRATIEIKAGRVAKLQDTEYFQEDPAPVQSSATAPKRRQMQPRFDDAIGLPPDVYSGSIDNMFGCKSLSEIKEQLSKETVTMLKAFSLHKLGIEMPKKILAGKLLEEIFLILDNLYPEELAKEQAEAAALVATEETPEMSEMDE